MEASSCLGERVAWNAGKMAKAQAEGNSPTGAKPEVVHLPRQTFANGEYLLLLKQLVSATEGPCGRHIECQKCKRCGLMAAGGA